jgi:hypothetical protein
VNSQCPNISRCTSPACAHCLSLAAPPRSSRGRSARIAPSDKAAPRANEALRHSNPYRAARPATLFVAAFRVWLATHCVAFDVALRRDAAYSHKGGGGKLPQPSCALKRPTVGVAAAVWAMALCPMVHHRSAQARGGAI